jgi:ABC-2 type transport system permease protein
MTAASVALARRTFLDSRTRNVAFAYLFVAATFAQVYGYRHTYSTLADRLRFAHSFGDNKAVRLLYGEPHDLLTVGGYAEWRAGWSSCCPAP